MNCGVIVGFGFVSSNRYKVVACLLGLGQWWSQKFIFRGAIYKILCVYMKSKIVMYNTS